ncbi:MAG: peptidase M15 [Helicobacteraceae bacterium]|nr:peptidase M15 [Helicobacteraceae bacterium]
MNRRTFLTLVGTSTVAQAGLWPFSSLSLGKEEPKKVIIKDNIAPNFVVSQKIVLSPKELLSVTELSRKIRRARNVVGYGNFSLLGFDHMRQVGKYHSKVGVFTKAESALFEKLFYKEASEYGFYGEKVITSMTNNIKKRETVKIPRTGHHLYKGKAEEMYTKVREEVGHSIILTSGVRSVVKQMDLFLAKIVKTHGDVSLASNSLAPAGYSFHGVGDFDVGKVGYGYRNFTSDFAQTDEYKKLIDTGYIKIRYTKNNPFGVRYEPWHIKVV